MDLTTTVRPGQAGYPLNAARDALQDRARWAFNDLVEEVERENESVGRSMEDEVFEPDSEDAGERRGATEIADLAAEAFADAAFQRALAEAAGGIADFYAERAKDPGVEAPTASLAPAGTRARPDEDQPRRGAILPPGMAVAQVASPVEADIAAPSDTASAARQLRAVLGAADEVIRGNGGGSVLLSMWPAVEVALDRAEAGDALSEDDVATLQDAISRAADSATGPAGGGLLQAASLTRTSEHALDAFAVDEAGDRRRRVKRNPFGKLAGLRVSKKNYDRRRAWRFKKSFQRWMPHLTAWDATLRLVAAEAHIRRSFKPGFVLDDELLGLTTTTSGNRAVVYLHPDRLEQVIKAHKLRPLAIAAYLHGVACHELTHLDGRMGRGHSEEFVSAREDLGHATGHLLPAIDAAIVASLRGLHLDEEVMAWLTTALRASMEVEKADNSAAVARLQAQYDKLQRRIDAAYEDRLDGRIDAAFFDRKAREWREEQATIRRQMAAHEAADQGYMEAGIALLELAQRAVVLYELQDGPEKRRLLQFVYLNSTWDGEHLDVEWRQPFDIIAESIEEAGHGSAPGGGSEGRFDRWLPLLDTLRTRFLMPDDELRADMELYGSKSAQAGVEG